MDTRTITIIFFFYGLAFFCMGFAILLERNKCSDPRLRHALLPLAAFGLIHGAHEWLEMFDILGILHAVDGPHVPLEALRLALLAFSFLSLAAFGASLLTRDEIQRRYSLLLPISLTAIWAFGMLIMRGQYTSSEMLSVADVWTRYVLAIPAAIVASVGLIYQQRAFRRSGLAQFGRDALWAAIAFSWYGLIGQMFTQASPLPPSNVVNQRLFQELFGFPVQLLRAGAAVLAAVFVIRFMRAFEYEVQRRLTKLQEERVKEAERREALRGDLLRRIVAAQEAERQRIARELHDETGQALTAIGLGLRSISTTLRQDSDKTGHNLRQLEGLVAQSLEELQRLIADLRPSHLDDLGLAAAIRWYTGEIQRRSLLRVDFETDGDQRELSPEVKTALFRVVQEALNNVVKHAQATKVYVRLEFGEHAATILVSDNGRGFNPNKPANSNRPAWGLEGMRERANLLGGSFDISSRPQRGTQVEVTIPYLQTKNEVDEHEDTPITRG